MEKKYAENEEILAILKEVEKERNIRFLGAAVTPLPWTNEKGDYAVSVGAIYVHSREYYEEHLVAGKKPTMTFGFNEKYADERIILTTLDLVNITLQIKQGNPQTFEWLRSPRILCSTPIWNRLAKKLDTNFDERHAIEHYYYKGKTTFRKSLKNETLNKPQYLVSLSSLWCSKYILENHAFPPTFDFAELMEMECEASEEVKENLRRYKEEILNDPSIWRIGRLPLLDNYIQEEVERQKALRHALPPIEAAHNSDFTAQFKEAALKELWGSRKKAPAGKKANRKHAKK